MQRPDDVLEAKRIVRGRAAVMSKIEKPQTIDGLAEIIEAADALMVARGDLGVEMPVERVPGLQKQMTRMARHAGGTADRRDARSVGGADRDRRRDGDANF